MDVRRDAAARGGGQEAPLGSLLRVLRASLEAKVLSDGGSQLSLNSHARHAIYRPEGDADAALCTVSTNALLASIVAGDPGLHRSIQTVTREVTKSARLNAVQRRRHELQKLRGAWLANREHHKRLVEYECETIKSDTDRQCAGFEHYAEEQGKAATQRLQALFYECVAEMKKAIVRMDGVAADALEEATSLMDARERRFRWQLFLARLEEDFHGGSVSTSVLCPQVGAIIGSSSRSSDHSPAVLCSALDAIMQSHGPSIPSQQSLEIKAVLATTKTSCSAAQSSLEKPKRLQSSLHFEQSASEAWSGIANELQQHYRDQRATVKPAPLSARSTRRIRRLPVPTQQPSQSDRSVFQTAQEGSWSRARQLTATETPQFTGIECDIPLSSSFVRWLTPSASHNWHSELVDSNIYFDLSEYRNKFPTGVQSTGDSDHSEDVSDIAVLSSVRSALKDVNVILDSYRASAQAGRPVHEMVTEHQDALLLGRCEEQRDGSTDSRDRVFARASVLQLVQTTYFSTQFFSEFPAQDRSELQQLYPPSLMGAGFLSTLYIPRADTLGGDSNNIDGNTTSSQDRASVIMAPLSDAALHELMLVYIARARRSGGKSVTSESGGAQDVLTSMAQSDATQTLLPRQPEPVKSSDTLVCVIRNPRAVLQPFDPQMSNSVIQAAANSDYLFIELRVADKNDSSQSPVVRPLSSERGLVIEQASELLGASCQWRSCLDSVVNQSYPSVLANQMCSWHNALKAFLSDKDGVQYLPSIPDICTTLADSSLTRAESSKRAVLRSSSLLEELVSRQLCHSLCAFFDYVRASLTNSAFLKAKCAIERPPATISLVESGEGARRVLLALQDALELTQSVLQTERRATLALHCLRKLVGQNHPHAVLSPSNVLDVAELNRDIRTTDLELVLQLSRQKLQRLEQLCRAEEDARETTAQALRGDTGRGLKPFESIDTSGPAFDVVHVLRKGRRSLQRQQQEQQQPRPPPVKRPQSAARRSKLENPAWQSIQRVASDFDQRQGAEWLDSATEQQAERKRDRRALRRVVVR